MRTTVAIILGFLSGVMLLLLATALTGYTISPGPTLAGAHGFVGWMGDLRLLRPAERRDHLHGAVPGVLTRGRGVGGGDSSNPDVGGGLPEPTQRGASRCR